VDLAPLLAAPESEEVLAQVATVLGSALKEIGFAVLVGHGIDPAMFEEVHAAIEPFFAALTHEQKVKHSAQRKGSVNQGYFGIAETSQLHPDQVEGWVFCRRAFRLPDGCPADEHLHHFWPDAGEAVGGEGGAVDGGAVEGDAGNVGPGSASGDVAAGAEAAALPRSKAEALFRTVVAEEQKLVKPLMRAILHSLGEADARSFDADLTDSNFGFRLNYYPPLSDAAQSQGVGRMLGHEDVDLFTLLPASPVEGLQVLNRANGKWVRMEAPTGSIILNAGDYLQRITTDVIPSTTHRVAPPRDPKLLKQCRTSFPMAVYLNENVVLKPLPSCGSPRYPVETAIDFHTKITSKYYGDDYRATNGED
jgi:isopenicillin N synthase-like dioxygenase